MVDKLYKVESDAAEKIEKLLLGTQIEKQEQKKPQRGRQKFEGMAELEPNESHKASKHKEQHQLLDTTHQTKRVGLGDGLTLSITAPITVEVNSNTEVQVSGPDLVENIELNVPKDKSHVLSLNQNKTPKPALKKEKQSSEATKPKGIDERTNPLPDEDIKFPEKKADGEDEVLLNRLDEPNDKTTDLQNMVEVAQETEPKSILESNPALNDAINKGFNTLTNNKWYIRNVLKPKQEKMNALIDRAVQPKLKPLREVEQKSFNLLANASKEQSELIKRAFAADNVAAEFHNEKEDLIKKDLPPHPLSSQLPGWGEWAGEGISLQPKKVNEKQQEEYNQKRKDILQSRKDKHLPHVIINPDTSGAKLRLGRVPRGFRNSEDWNRVTRNPLGSQWNTLRTFEQMIKPSIATKAGVYINPIQKKLVTDTPESEDQTE